jgi:potassium-transporting ATPase KdpC subunit
MWNHLRGNLVLFGLTVVVCCVLYPLVLWGIGQTAFRDQAQGSLIDADGKPTNDETKAVGSSLIAQPFNGDEYFKPRPSAVSYNASASGGSNLAASNPQLRDRAARTVAGEWARNHPDLAKAWVRSDPAHAEYVRSWQEAHADAVAGWRTKHPDREPSPEDFAGAFFKAYARSDAATKPEPVAEVLGPFRSLQRERRPGVELENIPADAATASGSGLDPHITKRNAVYQTPRVVAAQVEKLIGAFEDGGKKPIPDDKRKLLGERLNGPVGKAVDELIAQQEFRPMFGLTGDEPLVNVLQLNLALKARMAKLQDEYKADAE